MLALQNRKRGLMQILLITLCLCASCDYADGIQRESRVRTEIGTRLGVEPSWEAISMYVDQAIKPGIDRADVNRILAGIGPYEEFGKARTWNPDLQQYVNLASFRFTDPIIYAHLSGYTLEFDDEGVVLVVGRLSD